MREGIGNPQKEMTYFVYEWPPKLKLKFWGFLYWTS